MEGFVPRNSRPEVLARKRNRLNLPQDQLWQTKTQEFDLISDFLSSQPSQDINQNEGRELEGELDSVIPDSPMEEPIKEIVPPVVEKVTVQQSSKIVTRKPQQKEQIPKVPKAKKIPIDKSSSAITKAPVERKTRVSASTKNRELKVVHSMILEVIEEFKEENEDESNSEIDKFKKEITADLKEYTQLSMQRRELGKQLREAVSQKKKLRKALLDSQKEGQNILAEIGEVKKQHKHSEEKRKKTEQAHDFLNHFEILQEDVRGSKDNEVSYVHPKNFHSLVRSMATQSQMFATLQGINSCLRAMNTQLDSM